MHSVIDRSATLGMLAAESPVRIRLFERLGFDYCCGGTQSLAEACEQRCLDIDWVREQLEGLARDDRMATAEWHPQEADIDALCDHIVSVHHDYLREEMPRITELLEAVVRVHGKGRPDLEMVQRTFASLRSDLEEHIGEEERVLFPTCRALEQGAIDPADVEHGVIDRHRSEHEAAGRKLVALRELAGGYEISQALCSTHGSLLEALRRFEADLHEHVHEENNVLLPRVDALLDRRSEGPSVAVVTTVDALIESLTELADAGRGERACRLAASAYAGLRRSSPVQAQRLNALMHKLVLSPRPNDDKE